MPTKSWRGKSAVFRIYSALTSHGYSKSIKAVRRQRNLGLDSVFFGHCIVCPSIYGFWLYKDQDSDPLGVLWTLYCLSFDVRILIASLRSETLLIHNNVVYSHVENTRGVHFTSVSTIFLLDFGNVLMVLYFLFALFGFSFFL